MNRNPFHGRIVRMTVLLLFFVLSRETQAWGGEAGNFGPDTAAGDVPSNRITLSIRIAEAKGKNTRKAYFQSLLRHRKRKPVRRNPAPTGLPPTGQNPQT